MKSASRIAWVALAAATLAACSTGSRSMREAAGLEAPPPDEFIVVARAPLEMPPDLRALPAPQPGAPSRLEPDARAQAQQALTGGGRAAAASTAPTTGETALLSAAGASAANAPIREQIVVERPAPTRRYGLDSLFGVRIVQDPAAEAERLSPQEEAERLAREGLPAPTVPPAP